MASMGNTRSRRTVMLRPRRPARSAAVSAGAASAGAPSPSRWCRSPPATRRSSTPSQKADSWFSTTPLPGTPLAITTSNAEMRSVATTSSRAASSAYRSRTLPLPTRASDRTSVSVAVVVAEPIEPS